MGSLSFKNTKSEAQFRANSNTVVTTLHCRRCSCCGKVKDQTGSKNLKIAGSNKRVFVCKDCVVNKEIG